MRNHGRHGKTRKDTEEKYDLPCSQTEFGTESGWKVSVGNKPGIRDGIERLAINVSFFVSFREFRGSLILRP